MKFKGTKGEWKIETSNDFHEDCRIDYIPKIGLTLDEYADIDEDEFQYNLLLISKAPEMLEILQKLCNLNPTNTIGVASLMDKAEILIKKATEI
jgi:hypothetical protein